GPVEGALAVGEGEGPGRMLEPDHIVEHVGRALGEEEAFRGRRVLVTAGPTREAIDPVRYVGNRSSGRMGYALAQAAWRRGAEVVLVSGPTALEPPVGAEVLRVESAREMHAAVAERIGASDLNLLVAAVADYRPAAPKAQKVKRKETGESLVLPLEATADIALETAGTRKPGSVTVGFALETIDLLAGATAKLEAKRLDLVVANDASESGSGFEVATNRVTLLAPGCPPEALPLLPKHEVAERILDRVAPLLEAAAR
ncbi:MAG TPA: phosphopantothenoylcysteine decarboxylase, partial [Longimicrobiales bacterium]|nr:phosphopantothenoylcysteine decarboxylase [Longimicrobiales bacterium]